MMKQKNKPLAIKILRILMVLCAAGLLYSGFVYFQSSREHAQGDAVYQEVRQMGAEKVSPSSPLPQKENVPPSPAPEEEEARVIDFAALRDLNPDIVAWLTAEGTEIDYPVVQGTDNDFYLRHLFTGERNKLGSLFLDYRSDGGFSDRMSVIYGHNMLDASMFSSLTSYKEQDYYDEHPEMALSTAETSYRLVFFAGIIGDGAYEFIRLSFEDDADFLQYAASLKEHSTFESAQEIGAQDKIVALSTCTYEFYNARYVLFGTLLPQD